jgi:hypothetical protein
VRPGCDQCGELLASDECPLGEHCNSCCICEVCNRCGDVVWNLADGMCGECAAAYRDWLDWEPRPVETVPVVGGVL